MAIHFTKLRIENLRGIRDGTLDGLTDVNILVGRNNSGKSTVLDALTLAAAHSHRPDDPTGRGYAQQVFKRHNEPSEYADSLWHSRKRDHAIGVTLTAGADAQLTIEGRRTGYWNNAGHRLVTDVLTRLILFDSSDGRRREVERLLWPALLATRDDKRLLKQVSDIFALNAETTNYLTDEVWVLLPDRGVRLDDLGDGARACLRMLLCFAAVQNTTFLLEEPETHQHPAALERLAKTLCQGAKQSGIQLFLTTHSRECVRYFLDASTASGLVATVHHTTLEKGSLRVKAIPAETAKSLLDSGPDPLFLDLYA